MSIYVLRIMWKWMNTAEFTEQKSKSKNLSSKAGKADAVLVHYIHYYSPPSPPVLISMVLHTNNEQSIKRETFQNTVVSVSTLLSRQIAENEMLQGSLHYFLKKFLEPTTFLHTSNNRIKKTTRYTKLQYFLRMEHIYVEYTNAYILIYHIKKYKRVFANTVHRCWHLLPLFTIIIFHFFLSELVNL